MDDVDAVQAQIARNMLESGDWVTARLNGVAYLEKAPLKYWMIAVSYMMFGVHDWAARIPVALAAILLAWVTYYGAALAALKRSHIGVPELVRLLPPKLRLPLAVFAEACVFAFFLLLAWVGYSVLEILASDNLVSLPQVSVAYAQSVLPISAVLFIIAQAFALPEVLHEARQP